MVRSSSAGADDAAFDARFHNLLFATDQQRRHVLADLLFFFGQFGDLQQVPLVTHDAGEFYSLQFVDRLRQFQ